MEEAEEGEGNMKTEKLPGERKESENLFKANNPQIQQKYQNEILVGKRD